MVIESDNIVSKKNKKFSKIINWINHLEREQREVMLAVIVGLLGGLGAFILRVFIYIVFVLFISLPISFLRLILINVLPEFYVNFIQMIIFCFIIYSRNIINKLFLKKIKILII